MYRMKICRSAFALSCCPLFFIAAQAPKQAAPAARVSLKIYSDSTNGVSFSYPAGWKMSREPSFYLAPLIFYPQQSAQAMVSFRPSGTHIETNFDGLEFAYVALSEPDQTSCLQQVTKDIDPEERRLETVTINGTRFFDINTGDAGLCHQANRNIYETYRHGTCLLFEAAFYTVCPDPDDGRAQLTAAQSKALSRPLDAIIQTVKVSPAK
jgi:hypothetical protein